MPLDLDKCTNLMFKRKYEIYQIRDEKLKQLPEILDVMVCGKLNWSYHSEKRPTKANKVFFSLKLNVAKEVKSFNKQGL